MSVASEQKQTDGTQKTQIVDSNGSNVTTFPSVPAATPSVDIGQDLSLGDTNSHAFGTSAVAKYGIMVSCPIANTKPVYIGLATGVTTGTGIELQPGDREMLWGVLNSNLVFAITGTATQHVRALAI